MKKLFLSLLLMVSTVLTSTLSSHYLVLTIEETEIFKLVMAIKHVSYIHKDADKALEQIQYLITLLEHHLKNPALRTVQVFNEFKLPQERS